ncbi:MAG TPA: hypothetical protein DHW82_08945 [Spirochaetia bacterium]|nr:MAG: hypothetical protein A2Y41_13735 [Spirochaetes bacterium GWB1_36_13]HCL57117.1 hypothetical protein [Spirochaetia bacterium]
MDLTIKDISHLFQLSEKEVKNLIKKNELPFQTINGQCYFHKQQMIEWALARNLTLNLSKHENMSEYHIQSLNTVLDPDAFFYHCDFSENSYIEEMVQKLPLEKNIDRSMITELLKSREKLMSTAIGNGISLPHPRIPLMLGRDKPMVHFFFLETKLDLQALDQKPVHTIILLISQSIKQHLSLLSHLSFLLSKETFRKALSERLEYQSLIDLIQEIENPNHE